MEFKLIPLCEEDTKQFKADMQEAFKVGAIEGLYHSNTDVESGDMEILPEKDIDRSLNAEGAIAYAAYDSDSLVGGAIVIIDEVTQHNSLDFLYAKVGVQSKGVGSFIWKTIELLHPQTRVWETCTPYFEKRNIHFYINKCGFHATAFYNEYYCDPNDPNRVERGSKPSEQDRFNGTDEMFLFQKVMQPKEQLYGTEN